MKPATPPTEPSPSAQLRKVVFADFRMQHSSSVALAVLLLLPLITPAFAEDGVKSFVIHDAQGRELIPGGYVAITEDGKGTIHYTPDDYRRMVRMGANFQVIRTTLGRLGGWPGKAGDPTYLKQLDDMVRMGREAGLQTVFKLVVYDLRPFGDAQWDAIYQNTDGTQDAVVAAWSKLWIRYKDDPSVFGYDLLNEPQRGLDPDEERCCREQLLPTLRRLADAMHAVSPAKWALYQPLYKEVGTGEGPFLPMREPLGRERGRVCAAPVLDGYGDDEQNARPLPARGLAFERPAHARRVGTGNRHRGGYRSEEAGTLHQGLSGDRKRSRPARRRCDQSLVLRHAHATEVEKADRSIHLGHLLG